jgi:hypothetical protein
MGRRSLLALLLCAFPSGASTSIQMDLPALSRAATDVVRVEVRSARCEWTEDHRRLVTFVEVLVLEAWKGGAAGRLTVVQPGGERDGIGQRVSGVAPLSPGEELVLFLEAQGPLHRVVGLAQGVYRVQRSAPASAARAVPAGLEELELVAPRGAVPAARLPVALDVLRDQVRRAAVQR